MAKSVSAAELNRAKKQTVAAVFSNLENHSIVAEDIGRQILTYGERCGLPPSCAAMLCFTHAVPTMQLQPL